MQRVTLQLVWLNVDTMCLGLAVWKRCECFLLAPSVHETIPSSLYPKELVKECDWQGCSEQIKSILLKIEQAKGAYG